MTHSLVAPSSTPTAGIQEAIDRLPPTGGVVELAAARFPLRRPILPRAGVTLRGQGASTVLTMPPPHVTPLRRDASTDPTSVEVQDASPFGTGDALTLLEPYIPGRGRHFGYYACAFELTHVTGNVLHGRRWHGPPDRNYRVAQDAVAIRWFPAIFVREVPDVLLESFTIDGGYGETLRSPVQPIVDFVFAAVSLHNAPRCRVRDLHVHHWPCDGICAGGADGDSDVSHCIAEHCAGNGFHTGGGAQSGQWTHNISRHNQNGFMFCQGNRHIICAHNLVHHNRELGIWGLDPADQFCVVAHNICHHNGWHGIEAEGSIHNVIQGNICRNNSQAVPGKYAGIYLRRHRDNVVTDNLCMDDQETPTQLLGIDADSPLEASALEPARA